MHHPVTAIVVGAGHRSLCYASFAKQCPDKLHIVGVADPNPLRRLMVAAQYGLSPSQCFESAEELSRHPRKADAVINGTMDADHVPTSLPLLEAGYHILLEKPFSTNPEEMWQLVHAARKHRRKVLVCHVLRYTPFYSDIRARVARGEIGEVIGMQAVEHVSYHHMAVGFVHGKWNRRDRCKSSMLLAKCCHDLDLLVWMKSGVRPVRVSSLGGLMQFRREKAPPDAGTRCLVDCPIEGECLYSARKLYLDHPTRWAAYTWAGIEHIENPTLEQKIEYLKTESPFGRCVWKCDNDVVDHQSVVVEFHDGCTATHNMIGGVSRPMRSIHLIGTTGEIQGIIDESKYVVRRIDPRAGHEYSEETVDLNVTGDMQGAFGGHGGGDLRLVADFVEYLKGGTPSISCTSLDDSIYGHLLVFLADEAMATHTVLPVPEAH